LQPHIIDTRQLGCSGIIAATAVETRDGVVLFDTGPESTFTNVGSALQKLGMDVSDVKHVFLSHIHFDHAGAAFRFAEAGATVYVHPRGAPHLIDPARLVESATRIFGSDMQRLWGRVAPVPESNVRVLNDNDVVRVGDLQIRAVETPGHASHHHVYHWDDAVFGGDIAGVRIGNGPPIPPFVPPELHVESWLSSIEKIRGLRPRVLYLPHFGAVTGSIEEHLNELQERVTRWSNWFREEIVSGKSDDQLVRVFAEYGHGDLRRGGANDSEVEGYEAADPSYMAVPAAMRYWRKYHPEQVGG
jgi:glyoxylase-like metal-dependent hydrolase (beta-lactamase superfamily II)